MPTKEIQSLFLFFFSLPRSGIVDLLVDSQRRMENLAKVIRMKNAKYARIEALNKNIAKETEVIKGLRGER